MLSAAAEIKILVNGLLSGESEGTNWFFEFNSFL